MKFYFINLIVTIFTVNYVTHYFNTIHTIFWFSANKKIIDSIIIIIIYSTKWKTKKVISSNTFTFKILYYVKYKQKKYYVKCNYERDYNTYYGNNDAPLLYIIYYILYLWFSIYYCLLIRGSEECMSATYDLW